MLKKVNGKTIEISNISIFDKALEGLKINRQTENTVDKYYSCDTDILEKCITYYQEVYNRIPFPLYGIDEDIKYAVIGWYLKSNITDIFKTTVDKGLLVQLKEFDGTLGCGISKALKFVNNTWGIIDTNIEFKDNLDIENYKTNTSFNEFKWVLNKLKKDEDLSSFYSEFLPEFIDACNKDIQIMKWELNRILDIREIPNSIFKTGKIIDINNGDIYTIDLHSYIGIEPIEIPVFEGLQMKKEKREEISKTYDFSVYKKNCIDADGIKTYSKAVLTEDYEGFASIFETILNNDFENAEDTTITGIIDGNNIIYCIEDTIYRCKLDEYEKSIKLIEQMSLVGYQNNKVYVERKHKVADKVYKKSIYYINIKTNEYKLCRINYD